MGKSGSQFPFPSFPMFLQDVALGIPNKELAKVMLPNMIGAWWLKNAPDVQDVAMLVVAMLVGAKPVGPWNSFTSVFLRSSSVFFSVEGDPVAGELSALTAFALSHSTISLNFSFE